MSTRPEELEKIIGYTFTSKDLLREALTHRSYLNENHTWSLSHNERLEYLGDAVLELVVTEYLFKKYPDEQEGQLTLIRAALVNYQFLAQVAEGLSLKKYILLSRGEAKDSSRAKEVILANGMEALIGAVYIDGGFTVAEQFIQTFILSKADGVVAENAYKDAKSLLQEIVQEAKRVTPTYRIVDEYGPDHEKIFTAGAYVGDKKISEGRGPSKQEAELDAARHALEDSEYAKTS